MNEPNKTMTMDRQSLNNDVEDSIDLRQLWGVIVEAKWIISIITILGLFGGVLVATFSTPQFRSDALVMIEEKKGGAGKLDELSAMMSGGGQAVKSSAEIEILKSRSLLEKVVIAKNLQIVVQPNYFPKIGKTFARWHGVGAPASPLFGLGSYAWGGERIRLDRFDVPAEFENRTFTLIALSGQKFKILDQNQSTILTGEVGIPVRSNTGMVLYLSELSARPGTEFSLQKQSLLRAVTELQSKLQVTEKGKMTNLLQIGMEGEEPKKLVMIIDEVANTYLRQNVERNSEEAQKMLAFLDEQLPRLKSQVDQSDNSLQSYQSNVGSVDLSLQAQNLLQRSTQLEGQISQLNLQRAELEQRFTANHPSVATLNQKMAQLKSQLGQIEGEFRKLPQHEIESLQLKRNATVANDLYVAVLNRVQELKVTKAGTIGNVQIIDHALFPEKPFAPKKPLIVAMGFLLGAMLGFGIAFLRRALRRVIEDPRKVEEALGLPIYATIPHSPSQTKLNQFLKRKALTNIAVLARTSPDESSMESLRSLCTSLQFAQMEAKNNVIAITGATPGIGKSFISLNLAFLLADQQKSVLLIDADMRRGHLHESLMKARTPGLSELISGQMNFQEVVHVMDNGRISFLSTGTLPPNPVNLLMSDRFQKFLDEASRRYDTILLDCPPVLNMADSLIMTRYAGTKFVVVRGGVSILPEIQIALSTLEKNQVTIDGILFNDLKATPGSYGYSTYGQYYNYKYNRKKE